MADPRRILILLAHPVLERSRVNRRLAHAAATLPGVTVHDLYETYPSMAIDVKREQALLLEHDVYVLQHPFYWYSAPAMIKEWLDLVLEHGWAYGATGKQLVGKLAFNAISTGGPAFAYRQDGFNRFTIRQLLAPFDQTFHLCGVRYLAPFVLHAALRVETDEDLKPHTAAYLELLTALRDGTLDLERAQTADRLNDDAPPPLQARGLT